MELFFWNEYYKYLESSIFSDEDDDENKEYLSNYINDEPF